MKKINRYQTQSSRITSVLAIDTLSTFAGTDSYEDLLDLQENSLVTMSQDKDRKLLDRRFFCSIKDDLELDNNFDAVNKASDCRGN